VGGERKRERDDLLLCIAVEDEGGTMRGEEEESSFIFIFKIRRGVETIQVSTAAPK